MSVSAAYVVTVQLQPFIIWIVFSTVCPSTSNVKVGFGLRLNSLRCLWPSGWMTPGYLLVESGIRFPLMIASSSSFDSRRVLSPVPSEATSNPWYPLVFAPVIVDEAYPPTPFVRSHSLPLDFS
jgi:hypothetical protein